MSKERETLITDLEINAVDGFFYITRTLQAEIRELLAQPEQEPVAWHYIYDDGITVRERVTECMPLGEHYTITPLYTAQPKRKAIEDGELEVWYSQHTWAMDKQEYIWGFRDAEKCYGIGGEE
tara:strand:- start:407 stop:775 length:369 start_codon:yes stop_codon:yes gene_type:complete